MELEKTEKAYFSEKELLSLLREVLKREMGVVPDSVSLSVVSRPDERGKKRRMLCMKVIN
jgi:hypothetical protein